MSENLVNGESYEFIPSKAPFIVTAGFDINYMTSGDMSLTDLSATSQEIYQAVVVNKRPCWMVITYDTDKTMIAYCCASPSQTRADFISFTGVIGDGAVPYAFMVMGSAGSFVGGKFYADFIGEQNTNYEYKSLVSVLGVNVLRVEATGTFTANTEVKVITFEGMFTTPADGIRGICCGSTDGTNIDTVGFYSMNVDGEVYVTMKSTCQKVYISGTYVQP